MGAGKYIYCVINSGEDKEFDLTAIGDAAVSVHSIACENIAAVVSDTPVSDYPVSRTNMLAHQKVMEGLMKFFTVLPVKFGTVASNLERQEATERIRKDMLQERIDEFRNLLDIMENKIELGLKCLWTDMDIIFSEIVDVHTDIRQMKSKLAHGYQGRNRDKLISLGEKVKNALEQKREKEEKEVLTALKPLCKEWKSGNLFGDQMVLNTSFLVEKNNVDEFDAIVNQLVGTHNGRMRYKYVGPVPPCNFVELTIYLN